MCTPGAASRSPPGTTGQNRYRNQHAGTAEWRLSATRTSLRARIWLQKKGATVAFSLLHIQASSVWIQHICSIFIHLKMPENQTGFSFGRQEEPPSPGASFLTSEVPLRVPLARKRDCRYDSAAERPQRVAEKRQTLQAAEESQCCSLSLPEAEPRVSAVLTQESSKRRTTKLLTARRPLASLAPFTVACC